MDFKFILSCFLDCSSPSLAHREVRAKIALALMAAPRSWALAWRGLAVSAAVGTLLGSQVTVLQCEGPSMLPTINERGDRVLVETLSPRLLSYRKGDLVIARPPGEPRGIVCKRVIGVAGDLVRVDQHTAFSYYLGPDLEVPLATPNGRTTEDQDPNQDRFRKLWDEVEDELGAEGEGDLGRRSLVREVASNLATSRRMTAFAAPADLQHVQGSEKGNRKLAWDCVQLAREEPDEEVESGVSRDAQEGDGEMDTTTKPRYIRVPSGFVWLEGDNKASSSDSRLYGPVPAIAVSARVVARVWPLSQISFLQ